MEKPDHGHLPLLRPRRTAQPSPAMKSRRRISVPCIDFRKPTAVRAGEPEPSTAASGPRPTPRGLRAASPLTEVHRPRARQGVDVVGAPAYDPERSFGEGMS